MSRHDSAKYRCFDNSGHHCVHPQAIRHYLKKVSAEAFIAKYCKGCERVASEFTITLDSHNQGIPEDEDGFLIIGKANNE